MRTLIATTAIAAVLTTACVGGAVRPTTTPAGPADLSQLWIEPADIARRDLINGPGGAARAPDAARPFTFVKEDSGGYSGGYDVTDASGLAWSVKLGPEAQSEVAASRLLWAIGFHQPAIYYVPAWTMSGQQAGPQMAARFRAEPASEQVVADWSWYENEFVGTQPFKALVIANIMLNNWDWKTSNNKVYELSRTPGAPGRRYVVRDLGASLGKTAYPALLRWLPTKYIKQGSRNDIADFEAQGFIKAVDGTRVDFHYRGIHQSLIDTLTVNDVIWTAQLMSRLSDDQLRAAFRAAGYTEEIAGRYAAKLRSKIAEGLALAGA
jgi:hypothetical protein